MERLSPSLSGGPFSLTHCYAHRSPPPKSCIMTSRNVVLETLSLKEALQSRETAVQVAPGEAVGPAVAGRSGGFTDLCEWRDSGQDDISAPTQTQHRVGVQEASLPGGHLKYTTWVPHTTVLPIRGCHYLCHCMGTGNTAANRQIQPPALGVSTLVGRGL